MSEFVDYLLEDEVDEDNERRAIQDAINSGMAWKLEGHYGRLAMDYLNAGACVLGEAPHKDYWGNRIPSRYEVQPGTVGSVEYAQERGWEPLDVSPL